MGKVPVIVDGDFKLWESGAILLYLVEKYGKTPFLEQHTELSQWVLFANATLEPEIFVEASRERETPRLLNPLNQILEQQPSLLGEDFSIVDVAVGSILAYISMMLKLDLAAYTAILNYIKWLFERPALPKSFGDVVDKKGLGARVQRSGKKELQMAVWLP